MNINFKCFYIIFVVISEHIVVKATLEGFVVHGEKASIHEFPHCAYLSVQCKMTTWSCGSTILTQDILISAAHCFENCMSDRYTTAHIMAGTEEITQQFSRAIANYRVHENYDPEQILNDIALMRVDRSLRLSHTIKRVSLIREPDFKLLGWIAGWGMIDEDETIKSHFLRFASQKVWCREDCMDFLEAMPIRSFCAGNIDESSGYMALGDSGSGLVVKGYILIGILSYKEPSSSNSVAIYTNVASFYNWIRKTSATLYCQG